MRTIARVHALSMGISMLLVAGCSDVSAPPEPLAMRRLLPTPLIADGSGTWTTGPSFSNPIVLPFTGAVNGRYYLAAPNIHGTGPLQLQVFDPATGNWSLKPATVGRGRGMAAGVGGKFYVVGGAFESDPRIYTTDMLQSFDPATDTWTTLPPMPTPRSLGSAAELGGKLYVVGGQGACAPCGLRVNLTPVLEVYDPATNSWSSKAPMPMPRSFVSAAGVNGKLYVVSVDDTPSGFVGALDIYDPVTDRWSTGTPAPTARGWSGAAAVGGIIYSVSGYTSPFSSGASSAVEAYDPVTDSWASVASIPATGVYPRPQEIGGRLYTTLTTQSAMPTTTLRIFTPAPPVVASLRASIGGSLKAHVSGMVDVVSGSTVMAGTRGYFIGIKNEGATRVANATVTIATGFGVSTFPGISTLPIVAGPVTLGPGQSLDNVYFGQLCCTRVPSTVATGYDSDRMATPVRIEPGGATQTLRLRVRGVDPALWSAGVWGLGVAVMPGIAGTTVLSVTTPTNLDEGEILVAGGGPPSSIADWQIQGPRLNKEYTFVLELRVPNGFGFAVESKPAIHMNVVPFAQQSVVAGTASTLARPIPSLDGPVAGSGSVTFTVDQPANWSVSTNENRELMYAALLKRADVTPPVVTHTIGGAVNAAGWYSSDVTVTFAASDAESPVTTSGCEARTVTTDTPPDGVTFRCVATSAGGQTTDAVTIKLDKTAPTIAYAGNAGSYSVDDIITISCTASDALSGVASTSCSSTSGPAYQFVIGTNTLVANATDNAGNTFETTTSFTVAATPGSVSALVERFVASSGVANSLASKLAQGNYKAFRNELAAQSGKKISVAHAVLLETLSYELERP